MTTLFSATGRPPTDEERWEILSRVDELLELWYRSASLGNFDDPLEEAVYILLSRQTREQVYQRAHRDLRIRWRSWRAMLKAPPLELVEVLRRAGFARQRAAQLQSLLSQVQDDCQARGINRITLDWLRDLSDEDALRYLLSLPGIGPKSARCIMHYALNRQSFAVDTHVRRVLHRLRLVDDAGGKVDHQLYDSLVPARMRQRLHINLVHHGRAFCRSQRPRCGQCPLVSFCPQGRAVQHVPEGTPVAVELFAGGGGLGDGFSRAGFFVAAAVELDRNAAQTYRANHPGTVVIETDAASLSASELVKLAPASASPTVIIAGPPCQGYSAAGKRKADDARNQLYLSVIRLAKQLKPEFVAIENVPGMRKVEGRSYERAVLDALTRAGYTATSHLLRACDYGVPQLRHRLIFLARSGSSAPHPGAPVPTHCPGSYCEAGCGSEPGRLCGRPAATPSVVDTLMGLPALDHGQAAEYLELPGGQILLNGTTMRHSDRVLAKIRKISAGSGPISYRRLHQDLARTIVAGHRALPVHPWLDRTISVREAARLQGFRDSHVFAGPPSTQPLQVANAVPPPMASAVARAILEVA